MAEVKLGNLRNALTDGLNVQVSANPGGGRGGQCFGDSGGPLFYPADSNTIVAVTSFGGKWCRGVAYSYRTDRQAVIDWILATVTEATGADEAGKIRIV